eukprot:4411958-Pyramimonas_sp.AAC.1
MRWACTAAITQATAVAKTNRALRIKTLPVSITTAKEIRLNIIAPELRRTTGEAEVAFSRLRGMTPTGVKSLFEWEVAMYKSNMATHDTRATSKLRSPERLALTTLLCRQF